MKDPSAAGHAALDLNSPVRYLRGVGPQREEKLVREGVATVADLLLHLPVRYEDRSRILAPDEIDRPATAAIRARLVEVRRIRTRRRNLTLVRARALGKKSSMPVVWFNQAYLAGVLEENREYLLYGKIREARGGALELLNPSVTPLDPADTGDGRIVPIYPSLAGLGPARTRRLVEQAVAVLERTGIPDPLPEDLARRYGFPRLEKAYLALHRPRPPSLPQQEPGSVLESPARTRLAYQEFLELQLELAWIRHRQVDAPKGHRYEIDLDLRRRARDLLPFVLTGAQKRVLKEIVADMSSPTPMLRLLQGDVGSGKTIVAALALFIAAANGLQAAFLAPTELLAEQHFGSLSKILGASCRMALLTASSSEGSQIRERIAAGEIEIVVGTHALLQPEIRFARLALAVIDEQHRFGVEQRQLLQRKGDRPDVLVMTATPIPRTLAFTIYGDLAFSVLDELPPGRLPVETLLVPAGDRERIYRELSRDLASGGRAFVVLPRIEEGESEEIASIEREGEIIRSALAPAKSAVIHGRMPSEERSAIMEAFVQGDVQVLIATTVIEVGVDVPEATWMIIEAAERFGLSQLHQLRGRVGRGRRQGTCVAIHGPLGASSRARLEAFARTADGFELALIDLEQRGPGDLLGTRQSGLPTLRLADLVRHRDWLEKARADAAELFERQGKGESLAIVARARERAAERLARFGGG